MNTTDKMIILGACLLAASCLAAPCQSIQGAKSLFYRQQANPGVVINNGIQYWIELNRGGQVSKVSNKFAFKSGDRIKIHVTANIEGFAYIILREGSSGEQSVLFPDEHLRESNKITASTDYPIPREGYLAFDQNPGTEKLILLLSRKALDPSKYLADKTKEHVRIAAVPSGAKDLVPGSVVLAYSDQDQPATNRPPEKKPSSNPSRPSTVTDQSITTCVQTDPNQVLAIDLALLHEP